MGDVVSILNGPNAGQWFQVAQVIQWPTSGANLSYTVLMDAPLPQPSGGNYAISIDEGFVNETIGSTTPGQGNTIDIRGSGSAPFVLDGSQFGTQVLNNTFLGNSFSSMSGGQENASGTYSPFVNPNNTNETRLASGWTHTPDFGIQIDDNTFDDFNTTASTAPAIGVSHSQHLHSNIGRVYYTGQFENNVFVYSNPPAGSNVTSVLVGQQSTPGPNQDVPADPYELAVTASNNSQILPSSFTSSLDSNVTINAIAGTVNGTPITPSQPSLTISLPGATNPGAVNLAPYYDQVGFSSDNATGSGNLDGGGYSYSSNALGGGIVNWGGVPFVLGPVGQNDVVEADSQP